MTAADRRRALLGHSAMKPFGACGATCAARLEPLDAMMRG